MAGGTDLSYRLLMRDPSRFEELVQDLRELPWRRAHPHHRC
jgi:hypothetical protein